MLRRFPSLNKLTFGMRKFNGFFAFLFLGVVLGVLFSNLFQGTYYGAWENWQGQVKSGLASVSINGGELFVYVFIERVKAFVLLWVLATTAFGVPYLYAYCVYKGFTMGFLFCCVMQAYGVRAFLAFSAYYFPQCILYVPVFLLAFVSCRELNRHWAQEGFGNVSGKLKAMRGYLLTFFLLLVLLILGCLLEAYGNPGVLKGVL